MNMPAIDSDGGHLHSPVASLAPDSSPVASPAPDSSPVASLAPDSSPVASLAPDSSLAQTRLRLDIAYDGTDFAGWAAQIGQRTAAGTIDDALSTVFRTTVVTTAAGRTDAGVHATGQVAHVDIPVDAIPRAYPRTPRPGEAEFLPLVRRLARLLPEDVRVLAIARAPAGFDARFSALRRHYVYRLSTAPFGVEPQEAKFVTPWPRALDVEAMTSASEELMGLNDFAAFCRAREGATTIRDLQRLEWARDGQLITAHVTADAFCWSMVRSLVGALLAVGEGRRDSRWCAELLTATRRSGDFSTAPARGLTLVGVDYPADTELQARITVTRDMRTADELGRG